MTLPHLKTTESILKIKYTIVKTLHLIISPNPHNPYYFQLGKSLLTRVPITIQEVTLRRY